MTPGGSDHQWVRAALPLGVSSHAQNRVGIWLKHGLRGVRWPSPHI